MLRFDEGIPEGNTELLIVHPVQEHVDARQVVGGEVDFLAVEAADIVGSENLGKLEKQ